MLACMAPWLPLCADPFHFVLYFFKIFVLFIKLKFFGNNGVFGGKFVVLVKGHHTHKLLGLI